MCRHPSGRHRGNGTGIPGPQCPSRRREPPGNRERSRRMSCCAPGAQENAASPSPEQLTLPGREEESEATAAGHRGTLGPGKAPLRKDEPIRFPVNAVTGGIRRKMRTAAEWRNASTCTCSILDRMDYIQTSPEELWRLRGTDPSRALAANAPPDTLADVARLLLAVSDRWRKIPEAPPGVR